MTHLRLIALAALLLMGCPKHAPSSDSMPALIHRAQAMADTDRMAAIRLLEDYISSRTKDTTVTPWALLWAGEQRRIGGDEAAARKWFERLATRYPTHSLKGPAQLGMAVVDAGDSLSGNSLATLSLIGDDGVPDSLNADRYRILARVGADEGTSARKVRLYVDKAVQYSQADATVQARVSADLSDLIKDSGGQEVQVTQSAELQALNAARKALDSSRFDTAVDLAGQFLHTWPASTNELEAKYIIRRAKAGNPSTPNKVGVLLPLTGDYAPGANRIKATLEMSNRVSGSALTLVFADTAGSVDKTVEQVEKLVIEAGCVALLGPLLRVNGEAAAKHAQALRTPMVAMTQSGEPTKAGDFIYRGFLTMEQQVNALLDHAVQRAGHRRFAILHPRNSYGNKARDLFGAGVERRGGSVISVVGYETDTTDYRPVAKELAQTTLNDGAKAELMMLRAQAVRRGRDPLKIKVPNNLSFDAIFIPDSYLRLNLVASALAYEDFPIGRFGRGKTDKPVQLLGLNGWNDPSLAQSGGRYVWDSVFVDAFHSSSYAPPIQQFVTLFEEEYGHPPEVMDALAWDVLRLLSPAVQKGRASREAIQAALPKVRLTGPIAGGTHFGPSREVERELMILTIKPDGIDQWMMGGEGEEQ